MRRRSKKRQAELGARGPDEVSDDRTAVEGAEDQSFREFVRRLPCLVCLGFARSDPCHLRAKRRFGDWLEVAGTMRGNIFPACRRHHAEQHQRGVETFARAHGLELVEVCRVVGAAYLEGWSEEGLGAAARAGGYERVDSSKVIDGGLPY